MHFRRYADPPLTELDKLMDAAAARGATVTWGRRENSSSTIPTAGGLHTVTLQHEALGYSQTGVGETLEQAAAAVLTTAALDTK